MLEVIKKEYSRPIRNLSYNSEQRWENSPAPDEQIKKGGSLKLRYISIAD
ncbi:MAG: hypothetical protein Q8N08_04950 [Methanobacteriaceae archaeon]|nr:hypothetical protein [Methanobacteriaceae archaeon]